MASLASIISQHGKTEFNGSGQMQKMLSAMRHRGSDNKIIRSLADERGALGANEINLSPDIKGSSEKLKYNNNI